MRLLPDNYNLYELVSPLIFLILGGSVSFYFNNLSNQKIDRERKRQQKEIWIKQFDIFQAEPLVKLFKLVLIKIQNRYFQDKVINQDIINQLHAEISIIRFLDKNSKKQLDELYSLCLDYNAHVTSILYGNNEVVTADTSASTKIKNPPNLS